MQVLRNELGDRNKTKIDQIVTLLSAPSAKVRRQKTAVYFEDEKHEWHFWGNTLGAEWESFADHQRQAIAYERARYCPWRILWSKSGK